MCYAKSLRRTRDEVAAIAESFEHPLNVAASDFGPRYRIGVRQNHVVIRRDPANDNGLLFENAYWNFVPPGADNDDKLLANARSDGLLTKWPWKLVVRSGRCVVPADGFFEPEKKARAPGDAPWSYYRLLRDGVFYMAGLYSEAVIPEIGEIVTTYTVITTEPNGVLRVHNRMPVMLLTAEAAVRWVFEENPPVDLLVPAPDDVMEGYRVSDVAKNPKAPNIPRLIERVAEQGSLFSA